MAHYSTLGTHKFAEGADDIRGANVYGPRDEKIGSVDDVIFDHETMEIRYLVVDSGGWLSNGKFIVPAERISESESHPGDFSASVSQEQIENFPPYNEKWLDSSADWKRYEEEYTKLWAEDPLLHRKDHPDRIITPPDDEVVAGATASEAAERPAMDVSQLFPERMAGKFPDPAPGAGKVTARPKAVSRVEDAGAGMNMLRPRWDEFSSLLQRDREGIQARCPECGREEKVA